MALSGGVVDLRDESMITMPPVMAAEGKTPEGNIGGWELA